MQPYISSSCVRHDKICDTVRELSSAGHSNIELSGGTKHYEEIAGDLLQLKDEFNLNYCLHNYFPPPKEEFVLNLASLDDIIYSKTVSHYEKAIDLSRQLRADKFGLHAGFFLDFNVNQLGKKISPIELYDKDQSISKFCKGFSYLQEYAGEISLYVENNVLSDENIKLFEYQNPFMLTDYKSYCELKELIDFRLLLDVAHLQVSAKSLKLDFKEELQKLMPETDYIHISDNDTLADQNLALTIESPLFKTLQKHDLKNKLITLEVYGGPEQLNISSLAIEKINSNGVNL